MLAMMRQPPTRRTTGQHENSVPRTICATAFVACVPLYRDPQIGVARSTEAHSRHRPSRRHAVIARLECADHRTLLLRSPRAPKHVVALDCINECLRR